MDEIESLKTQNLILIESKMILKKLAKNQKNLLLSEEH